MAISFREFPWYVQAVIFLILALVVVVLGVFLPFSPVNQKKTELEGAQAEVRQLRTEVTALQVYQRRLTDFRAEMDALQKQLDTLRVIVPEDKEVDEFIRLMQQAAGASNVEVRRITSQPVVTREFHYEMPFEVQIDGPYYSIQEFFGRLGRLSRIINVGNIALTGTDNAKGKKYPVRPGTTVSGTFVATTFFSRGAAEQPAVSPGKQPGKQSGTGKGPAKGAATR